MALKLKNKILQDDLNRIRIQHEDGSTRQQMLGNIFAHQNFAFLQTRSFVSQSFKCVDVSGKNSSIELQLNICLWKAYVKKLKYSHNNELRRRNQL